MEDQQGELSSSSINSKEMTFAEFADTLCSQYMAIGITYDEYWHGNYAKLPFYREAFILKSEHENYKAWLQGGYVYDAMCMVSPILRAFPDRGAKPTPYHKTPYKAKETVSPKVAKAEFLAKWKANKEKWKSLNGKTTGGELKKQ